MGDEEAVAHEAHGVAGPKVAGSLRAAVVGAVGAVVQLFGTRIAHGDHLDVEVETHTRPSDHRWSDYL